MLTLSTVVRAIAFTAACAVAAPMACGGKVSGGEGGASGKNGSAGSGGTAGGTDGSGGSGGAVGGSGGSGGSVGGSGGSGGSTGGTGGSGGSTTGGSGGTGTTGSCVVFSSTEFDTSCNRNADCVEITPGPICDGYCECGGEAINRVSKPKYEAAIKGIVPADLCGCPAYGNATCVMGTCKNCIGSPPVCK